MKSVLLLVILIELTMVQITNAQNDNNITGTYSLGSGNPEGGSHLLVFEDGTYVILYFGGIQTGQWKRISGNEYQFVPANKGIYELYGRHDKNLADEETRISFNGFEDGETFVYVGVQEDKTLTMRRVFNSEIQSYSYPYVNTFKTKGDIISFMHKDYAQKPMVTYKNPEDYNDFIAFFNGQNHRNESQAFFATFKDNILNMEEGVSPQRVPFDEDDEEIDEIRALAKQVMNREVIYTNPLYNYFEGDINEFHVFNRQKGAYLDEEYYQEGEEFIESDESYDSMSIIYAFNVLNDFTIKAVKHRIDADSIFK